MTKIDTDFPDYCSRPLECHPNAGLCTERFPEDEWGVREGVLSARFATASLHEKTIALVPPESE